MADNYIRVKKYLASAVYDEVKEVYALYGDDGGKPMYSELEYNEYIELPEQAKLFDKMKDARAYMESLVPTQEEKRKYIRHLRILAEREEKGIERCALKDWLPAAVYFRYRRGLEEYKELSYAEWNKIKMALTGKLSIGEQLIRTSDVVSVISNTESCEVHLRSGAILSTQDDLECEIIGLIFYNLI